FVRSVDEHTGDVGRFLERVREREPGRPLFVLGHSMGGLIVALMLTSSEQGLRGAILSGAALRATRTSSRLLERLLRFLGRFFPRLPLPKIKSADVSRDPAVVERYDSDPLVFRGSVPAGTARAMIHGARAVVRDMESITLPILILHGSEDGLVHPDGSRELYERVASTDKALKVYEGLYHEIMNEPEQELVLGDILAWLDKRAT
ncbi:MAG: lysophospholipase, partial [Dehalococcoidia bacterium]